MGNSLFVGIYRGIIRNQGFLGGAKWISSIHSSLPVCHMRNIPPLRPSNHQTKAPIRGKVTPLVGGLRKLEALLAEGTWGLPSRNTTKPPIRLEASKWEADWRCCGVVFPPQELLRMDKLLRWYLQGNRIRDRGF